MTKCPECDGSGEVQERYTDGSWSRTAGVCSVCGGTGQVPVYCYVWKNNEKRATLYGRHCIMLRRMARNSALVRFTDNGQREVISRNALRRVK